MRIILTCVAACLLAGPALAEELGKPTKKALCQHLVEDEFHVEGRKSTKLQRACVKNATTVVKGKITDERYDILTGIEAFFDFVEGDYFAVGRAKIINRLSTEDNGTISNTWRVLEVSFEDFEAGPEREAVKLIALLDEVERAGDEEAVYYELEKLRKKGALVVKPFRGWEGHDDITEVFKHFSSFEELPDYELTEEVTTYWYKTKSGDLWPFVAYAIATGVDYEGDDVTMYGYFIVDSDIIREEL